MTFLGEWTRNDDASMTKASFSEWRIKNIFLCGNWRKCFKGEERREWRDSDICDMSERGFLGSGKEKGIQGCIIYADGLSDLGRPIGLDHPSMAFAMCLRVLNRSR